MSRKHYIEVARIIADQVEVAKAELLAHPQGSPQQHYALGTSAATARTARKLANMFAADKSRFDRDYAQVEYDGQTYYIRA